MNQALGNELGLRNAAWIGCLAMLFFTAGCAKEQDYLDVMNDQLAAMREVTEILQSVKDAPSMANAKRSLEANAEKYEAISKRANALPKPPPAKVQQRLRENVFVVQRTLDHMKTETERVSKLAGGPELLKQFESTKNLLSAVQP